MSNRDYAKTLIDQIPDNKLVYIIAYLQGAAIPEEIPNEETRTAILELENNGGHRFNGSTNDFFKELMED